MASYSGFRIPSLIEKECIKFEKSIEKFNSELSSIGLNYKQTDSVIKLTRDLLSESQKSIDLLLKNTVTQPTKIVDNFLSSGMKVLEGMDSHAKRFIFDYDVQLFTLFIPFVSFSFVFCFNRLKSMKKFGTKFVEPHEKSTGFKIKRVFDDTAKCVVSKSVQTTFQFIPISETLKALFSSTDFEETYINFNSQKDHDCNQREYTDFCCGDVYKSSDFFRLNPMAIQLRLFTDDFEPCDPLKSKAEKHKITAYYFIINNLPLKFQSNLKNIYLVALSDASDAKSELADAEVVIETIIEDLKSIERNGIVTCSGATLKGSLIGVIFDNLGGNNLFGFSGGFNANYYCRMCTTRRPDCQTMITENVGTIRMREEYERIVAQIQSGAALSLTESFGIKSACYLNTLDNFHILSNISVDLMHDIFEGCAGFLIVEVFKYCIANKIATLEQIQTLVECFPYGDLWKKNVPSKLGLEKKNLGQNASQMRCLILHLPFILFPFKNELQNIWLAVDSMLQIIQILLSYHLTESDLNRLAEQIAIHLRCYQLFFNQPLKPKHHFLLHYVRAIRLVGPAVRFWALRMEAKHQYFKRIIRATNNFINIKKTLAYRHQESFFGASFSLDDDMSFGKKIDFIDCPEFDVYLEPLRLLKFSDDVLEISLIAKSLKLNDRVYKPGILLAFGKEFYEIEYILDIKNEVLFLCHRCYEVLSFDSFLNSLQIQSKEKVTVLNLRSLENNKPFAKRNIAGSIYVMADSLDTYKMSLA